MEEGPPQKRLQTAPFAAHAARGIIRDQGTRRRAMAVLLIIAVLMVIAGSTLLDDWLAERVFWLVLFWLICGWITVTALLLAMFDLLMVRAQARAARRALRDDLR